MATPTFAGLIQLREALGLPEDALPIDILHAATENVMYLAELTSAVRQGSSINIQAGELSGTGSPQPSGVGTNFASTAEIQGEDTVASIDDEGTNASRPAPVRALPTEGTVTEEGEQDEGFDAQPVISFGEEEEGTVGAVDMTWTGRKSGDALSDYEFRDENGMEQEPIILSDSINHLSLQDEGGASANTTDGGEGGEDVGEPAATGVDILLGRSGSVRPLP